MKKLAFFPICGVSLMLLTPPMARPAETKNAVAAHTQDLVKLEGDKLVPFKSAEFLKAPYTVIYFSAGWCPDCRRFSPALVEAYGKQSKDRPRFEVVLFSMDKTAEGMLKFMKAENMNWPAIAFDKVGAAEDLKKYYSGHGIPCLSVIDPEGKLVLQSQSDQDALEVLKQLKDFLDRPELKPR